MFVFCYLSVSRPLPAILLWAAKKQAASEEEEREMGRKRRRRKEEEEEEENMQFVLWRGYFLILVVSYQQLAMVLPYF